MVAFWSPGWTLLGCAITAVATMALRRRVAQAVGVSTGLAMAYVVAAGAVLSITLAPRSPRDHYYVFGTASRSCDAVPSGATMLAALSTADWWFNLVMLLPLGWVCGSAPTRRSRTKLLVAAALVPVVIEAVQYMATDLHRVCQGLDLWTNWFGLGLGCSLAWTFRRRDVSDGAGARERRHAER
jgi:hypothetical protein